MGKPMRFSEERISALRERVRSIMSPYRFNHTFEVEKMAVRLGELYAPDKLDVLRVSALLHDVTKEKSVDEHIAIFERYGEAYTDDDIKASQTLHARTAALIIPDEYPEYAEDEIINAVRFHTTGRKEMSMCEMIIYLADYIDMSRKFDDCVYLREYFWGKDVHNMNGAERKEHLLRTLLISFDITVKSLKDEGKPVNTNSIEARAYIDNLLNK